MCKIFGHSLCYSYVFVTHIALRLSDGPTTPEACRCVHLGFPIGALPESTEGLPWISAGGIVVLAYDIPFSDYAYEGYKPVSRRIQADYPLMYGLFRQYLIDQVSQRTRRKP